MKDIREQLLAIGCKMEEEDMMVITLKSLSRAYVHFLETLNVTTTNVASQFDELCNKLSWRDRWKKQFCSSNEAQGSKHAFAANVKGKGKWAKKKDQGNGEVATRSLKNIMSQWQSGPYEETLQKEVG